jgi:hypothetical protein
MFSRALYAEYLAEVREQVCDHCPQRIPGEPPARPACRRCGVELQLPQLVESIREAGDGLSAFDPAPDRRQVCAACVCLDGGLCPCPAGLLSALVVRAVKAVEERRSQRDLLRRRLARPARAERAPVAALTRAYEAATGTCVGCD